MARSGADWLPYARELVSDLYERSPQIYWADFLLSIGGAWGLAVLFLRAGTFMHELVHLPLSALHRGLRESVLTAASAAVVNPYYRKRFPEQDQRHLMIVEACCFGYLCIIAALVYAGAITALHLLKACLLLAFALALNWFRTLAAHGFGNRGDRMTYVEPMSDSINITGLWRIVRRTAREDSAMPRWQTEPRRS